MAAIVPSARRKADVTLSAFASPEASGAEIVHRLSIKGFCTVDLGLTTGDCEKALLDVKDWESAGKWTRVSPLVQDGLLGTEGSATIAELESPDTEDEVRTDGETLMRLDEEITGLAFRMEPSTWMLNVELSHRTLAVMHQSGERSLDVAQLNEKQVMKWMSQFMRHRLMIIIFLGPTNGTLELEPYADSTEMRRHEIPTTPGTCVVLRPDLMSHKHFTAGRSLAISSFFLTSSGNARSISDQSRVMPVVKQLDEWAVRRLRELKESEREDQPWNLDIPREWQHAMNHMYHKGQMIGVRGLCFKMPNSDAMEDFFQVATVAPDYAQNVPLQRWDHDLVYDAAPESWRNYKTNCRHATFIDGIDLFDCKMFSMTPNEAKSVDPHQRLILEVGYQALYHMGMRKNTLVNASCGVYVGCGNGEWGQTDKELDFGAFGATGGALSISSGRFSFTLGLKGASMTLDTEASSGASAIYLAAESVQRKGNAAAHDLAIGIAAHILLAPVWWPSQSSAGWLSHTGRCLTFDESADGYIRADGVGACAMKCLSQVVDGQLVHLDDTVIGSLAGAMMNNNGRGASLAAPHGPAEQEAIAEAIRNASISPYDVDSVEAHGAGALLADAIEAGSMARAHRSEEQREPILVSTMKTSCGNQTEVGGMAAFAMALYSSQWGMVTPSLHLSVANPHMEAFDQPTGFVQECLSFRMSSTFSGVMSRGFGGSNVYLLTWGQLNDQKVEPIPQRPLRPSDEIQFWPGGGGELEDSAQPEQCYTIVGSWSRWEQAEPMVAERDGVYGITVTLGENCFEQFQIWLDGDPAKVLHPGEEKAWKDGAVYGPDEDTGGYNWMIDGRKRVWDYNVDEGALVPLERETADVGIPGDQYRIRLTVFGKWRSVSWDKVQTPALGSGSSMPAYPTGVYYLASAWNSFELEEMVRDPRVPGRHYLEVQIPRFGGDFQIVRDGDWGQVFYPSVENCRADKVAASQVCGPDDAGHGFNWTISCSPGDRFLIEFHRNVTAEEDVREVSWRRLDPGRGGEALPLPTVPEGDPGGG